MLQPRSKFEVVVEGPSGSQDCPKDVHAAARQCDDGPMVAFAFGPFAVKGGTATRLAEGRDRRLVEEALGCFVAFGGATQESRLAGLTQQASKSRCSGQCVGAVEAVDAAGQGDELCSWRGPSARHRGDNGGDTVGREPLPDCLVRSLEPVPSDQSIMGNVGDDLSPQTRVRDCDGLCLGSVYGRLEKGIEAAQPCRAPGVLGYELLAAGGQKADLGAERVGRLHRAQVCRGARQLGDQGGILGDGLAFAASGVLSRPVYGKCRCVNAGQPGLGEHRVEMDRYATQHVDCGSCRPGIKPVDPLDQHQTTAPRPRRPRRRQLTERWIAQSNQRSRWVRKRVKTQPEPSRVARMTSILTSLPPLNYTPARAGTEAQNKGKAS